MAVKKDYFKYLKMTLSYTNGRIWYLLLLSLLPSVLIAFIFSPYGSIDFLCRFGDYYTATFGEIMLAVMGISMSYYWLGIVGIFAVPFFLSILFGAVERHMRVGEFDLGFNRVRARLNFNYITAVKFTLIIFVVYMFFKFLQGTMFYLFCNSLQWGWALSLSIIWYVLIFFVELSLLSVFILWVPTMLQTGLNSAKSLGLSVRQGARYSLSTMGILLIPTIPMIAFMIVNSTLRLHIDIVLNAVLLTITVVYYVVLMYTIFFDINGIEREDIKKVDIWGNKKSRKSKKQRN